MPSFTDLPPELRRIIYVNLFQDARIQLAGPVPIIGNPGTWKVRDWRSRAEILQTSREIREEALPLYSVFLYMFTVSIECTDPDHFPGLSSFMRSKVGTLCFEFDDYYGGAKQWARGFDTFPMLKDVIFHAECFMPLFILPVSASDAEIITGVRELTKGTYHTELVQSARGGGGYWVRVQCDVYNRVDLSRFSVKLWTEVEVAHPHASHDDRDPLVLALVVGRHRCLTFRPC